MMTPSDDTTGQKDLYFQTGQALFRDGEARPEGNSWQAKSKQEGYDSARQEAESSKGTKQKPQEDQKDGKTKEPQATPEATKEKIDKIKKEKGGDDIPDLTPTPAPPPVAPAPPPEMPEEPPEEPIEEPPEEFPEEEPPTETPTESPTEPPAEPPTDSNIPQAVAAHIARLEAQIARSNPKHAERLQGKIRLLKARHSKG